MSPSVPGLRDDHRFPSCPKLTCLPALRKPAFHSFSHFRFTIFSVLQYLHHSIFLPLWTHSRPLQSKDGGFLLFSSQLTFRSGLPTHCSPPDLLFALSPPAVWLLPTLLLLKHLRITMYFHWSHPKKHSFQ
jgi:hypothetical protein